MNAHTIQLFDKIMNQSMARFAELPVVKTAVYTDNTSHIEEKELLFRLRDGDGLAFELLYDT